MAKVKRKGGAKTAVKSKSRKSIVNSKSFVTIAYVIVLIFGFAVNYNKIFDKKLDLNGDNAYYYIFGKAIADGKGYVNISTEAFKPNNHYPPGYSFLLSLPMQFSDNVVTMKTYTGLMLLGAVLVLFFIVKQITGNVHLAFVASFLCLFNYHLLKFSTILMSEVPFTLFFLLAIFMLVLIDFKSVFFKDYKWYLLIFFSVVALYIRTAGIALVLSVAVYFLINKKWKFGIGYFLGVVLAYLPWYLRGKKLGGSSYLKQLMAINPYDKSLGQMGISDFFTRFFANLKRYLTIELPNGCFGNEAANYQAEPTLMAYLFGILIVVLIIIGIFSLKKHSLLFAVLFVFTSGILLLWPNVWYGTRFMLPNVPLIYLFVMLGSLFVLNKVLDKFNIEGSKIKRYAPFVFLLLIFNSMQGVKNLDANSKQPYPANYKNFFDMASWCKNNLPNGVKVCSRKPGLWYVFGHNVTNRYLYDADTKKVLNHLIEDNTDYVVLEQLGYGSTGKYLYPTIQAYPENFKLVLHLKNPDTYLFKFIK